MQRVMKKLLPLAMAFGVSGCAAIRTTPDNVAARIQSEKPLRGNEMLSSLSKGNYSDFIRDFSTELKASMKPNRFRQMKSELDARKEVIAEWHLLDTLARGGIYQTEVWKVVLARTGSNGKTNVERLFFVATARLDGKESVIGFKFDSLF